MDNAIITVVGKKGSGKTFLTREILKDWNRVLVVDPMGEYRRNFETPQGLASSCRSIVSAFDKREFRISAQGLDPGDSMRLLSLAWEIRDFVLVVEEAGLLCSPFEFPEAISQVVLRGRHRGISQIYTAQRASTIHRNITSQSDLIVTFRQHEPRDISYLKNFIPDAETLKDLDDYQIRAYGDLKKAPVAVLARLKFPEPEPEPEGGKE